jgi:uncharacterized protein (TIGR03086 family)
MDDLERFLTAQRAFTDRVHAVSDDQWQLETPDTEWTVADLVAHLVDEHRWAAPLLHGLDLETAGQVVQGTRSLPVDGGVGANLAEEWDEAAVLAADAFAADGALDRTVELSRGATSVRDYIAEMTFDLVVHGWDLATAIGYNGDQLPDALVGEVLEQAKKFGDLSSSGLFDPPVDVAEDASALEKLIALTGRHPG